MSKRAIELLPGVSGTQAASNQWQALIPGVSQIIAVGASSVASSAFQTLTTVVQLSSTTDCWVMFGATPTAAVPTVTAASGGSIFIQGGQIVVFGVTPGTKIAAIENSAAGFLSIVEGA